MAFLCVLLHFNQSTKFSVSRRLYTVNVREHVYPCANRFTALSAGSVQYRTSVQHLERIYGGPRRDVMHTNLIFPS